MPADPLQQLLHQAARWQDLNEDDLTEMPGKLHHGINMALLGEASLLLYRVTL